jgi:mRNA interferase RelE/StbE
LSYSVSFEPAALKEWNALDRGIQRQIHAVLMRRLLDPHVASARLAGNLAGRYKIKHHKSGYRLVYQVVEENLEIVVLSVGKREDKSVYERAANRTK